MFAGRTSHRILSSFIEQFAEVDDHDSLSGMMGLQREEKLENDIAHSAYKAPTTHLPDLPTRESQHPGLASIQYILFASMLKAFSLDRSFPGYFEN